MATQMSNAATGGLGASAGLVREQATQVTDTAHEIARLADEVNAGAAAQITSLDSALSRANEMAASLGETTAQAESIATSTEELVSSTNEMVASVEQVSANSASPAASR